MLLPSSPKSSSNAAEVAGAVYHAAFDLVRVARVVGGFLQIAPLPTATASPGAGPQLRAQTVDGPEGGTAILTWDDRDGDGGYTSGDVLGLACDQYAEHGVVLTGAVTLDQLVIDGNVPDGLGWILTARMRLVGLQATIGASTNTLDGTFRLGRERRQTVFLLSVVADQPVALGTRELAAGNATARNDYLLDFSMGLFADGAVDDPVLGGTLTYATKAPLTGLQALPDPSAGLLEVRGAGGTKLAMVPLDFFTLELQVDEDGDGEIDATIPAEWAQF